MPGTLTPGQMFDHELNPVKGAFGPNIVDKILPIHPDTGDDYAEDTLLIRSGSVVSMRLDGTYAKWTLGVVTGAEAVPCFAFPNQNDFDVNSDVGNISGGFLVALPSTAPFELETTEFVAGTYAPNDPIGPIKGDNADLGKVTDNVAFGNDTICGVTTDGVLTNENGISVVRFWTYYLPDLGLS